MGLKLEALLLCLISTAVFSLPLTDNNSLVISSTTPAASSSKEELETAIVETSEYKEDTTPSVPKIYEMRVDANVSNRFATTLITSKVRNVAKTAQEATFSVVLPETAYISGFVMEIGGKSYEAYVKEKEEAKQIYDQAVSSGQSAAHVEANARDSNRFTVSVNVEPQSKATFKLSYEELLQRQNEQYEIVINIHPGQPVNDLNVEVHINETRPLKFVRTPALRTGNEIGKDDEKLEPQADIDILNQTTANVRFSPDVEKQKQLAHGLGTKEENGLSGQFVVQYDVERDPKGGEVLVKDGYFVHFFSPSGLPALPKHVVFVLDTSGSMDGIRIQQLKEAMNSILAELKTEDVFNIVEFASEVKVWNVDAGEVQFLEDPWAHNYYGSEQTTPKPNKTQTLPPALEANEDAVKKAKQVIDKFSAYGGTNIKSALEIGLRLVAKHRQEKNNTHQPLIVFLTDGEPTVGESNTDKIISIVSELDSGASLSPIFSLSFGDGADREFLQKISLKNQGFARHIYEAADASLQLQEFYKQISSPLLTNVTFKYVSNATRVTKTIFPIFFHGSEIVVAGKISGDEIEPPTVIGCGIGNVPTILIPTVENPVGALERTWAYLTVKQILEERDAAENKTEHTKKALDIALKYSFVTPVSSLVVVKPNDTTSNVATEDASKPGGGRDGLSFLKSASSGGPSPHYAFAAPAGASSFSSSILQNRGGSSISALYGNSYTAPVYDTESIDFRISAETITVDPYEEIKQSLPWLDGVLTENGTIPSLSENLTLALNEPVTEKPECPKTPINGTAGICTPLTQCSQVFTLLTSEQIFKDYFCPLEDKFIGVCCPTQRSTNDQTPLP